MIVYLAGAEAYANYFIGRAPLSCLISFFYAKENTLEIVKPKKLLLDSGAFTFLKAKKESKNINWDDYIERYANFISLHNVDNFLELDIDNLVGLKEVERLRKRLETLTGKRCIPVWHKSRGIEKWKEICKNYPYVAIGGIVTKEIKKKEHNVFLPMLKIAKEQNTKVHGLGFTSTKNLEKYKFYSVDSTSWISARFGQISKFNGKSMELVSIKDRRIKDWKEATVVNLNEWEKFQKYAEVHL